MTTVYFKGPTESLLGLGVVYTEFKHNRATRQVENYNGTWYSSRDEYHNGIGPGLYDGWLSDLDLSESEKITKEEFEQIWMGSE